MKKNATTTTKTTIRAKKGAAKKSGPDRTMGDVDVGDVTSGWRAGAVPFGVAPLAYSQIQ